MTADDGGTLQGLASALTDALQPLQTRLAAGDVTGLLADLGLSLPSSLSGQPGLQRLQGIGQRAGKSLQGAAVIGGHRSITSAVTSTTSTMRTDAADLPQPEPEPAGAGGAWGCTKFVAAAMERNVHAATWISRSSFG